jgi:hypothetical protein
MMWPSPGPGHANYAGGGGSGIIDSYSESNKNASTPLGSDTLAVPAGIGGGYGVCFTGNGQTIINTNGICPRLSFHGNAVAKIWTMTGTFGTNGLAGSVLATSDNVMWRLLQGRLRLSRFPFQGVSNTQPPMDALRFNG